MSSFCKCESYSHFFSKNIGIYAIVNDQSFNDLLTNNIVSFEQLGPVLNNLAKSFTVPILCVNTVGTHPSFTCIFLLFYDRLIVIMFWVFQLT